MDSKAAKNQPELVSIELNNVQESLDTVDGSRKKQRASDYHSKKSSAEGMMDISLLTANANQLKFILYYNFESRTFYPAFCLIILSLFLQVSIGFLIIFRVSLFWRLPLIIIVSNNINILASFQNEQSKASSQHSERIPGTFNLSCNNYQHTSRSSNHNRTYSCLQSFKRYNFESWHWKFRMIS